MATTREVIERRIQVIREERSRLDTKRNVLTADQLMQTICHENGVSYFTQLNCGRPFDIPALRQVIELEQRFYMFVSTFVAVRGISTLYDCCAEFLFSEGVDRFDQLNIGNCILLSPPIIEAFRPSRNLRQVPVITTTQVIQTLQNYRRTVNQHVNIESFSAYLAQEHKVPHISELCVRISKIGMQISCIRRIQMNEQKMLREVEEAFQRDVTDRVFALTKEKFSESNKLKAVLRGMEMRGQDSIEGEDSFMAETKKANKLSKLSTAVLQRATELDSYLDRTLNRLRHDLPDNYMSKVAQRDSALRRHVVRETNTHPRAQVIAQVLSSSLAKIEMIVADHDVQIVGSGNDDECKCCCVGKDSCECDCQCHCHEDDDEEEEKKEAPVKSIEAEKVAKQSEPAAVVDLASIKQEIQHWMSKNRKENNPLERIVQIETHIKDKFNYTGSVVQVLSEMKLEWMMESKREQKLVPKDHVVDFIGQCRTFAVNMATQDLVPRIDHALRCHFNVSSVEDFSFGSVADLIKEIGNKNSPNGVLYGPALLLSPEPVPSLSLSVESIKQKIVAVPYMTDIGHSIGWKTYGRGSLRCILKQLSTEMIVEIDTEVFMRVNEGSTLTDFETNALNGDGEAAAVDLFSAFVKSGGTTHFPFQFLQGRLRYVYEQVASPIELTRTILSALPETVAIRLRPLFTCQMSPAALKELEKPQESVVVVVKPDRSESKAESPILVRSEPVPVAKSGQKVVYDSSKAQQVIQDIRTNEFGIGSVATGPISTVLTKQNERLERALTRLSEELYSTDCHFILELIQNADDNTYPSETTPTISFELKDSVIRCFNNEIGFSEQNIRAICDIGASTKTKSSTMSIGQKGIGFKSIFKVTDRPEIHSGGFHVTFHADEKPLGYVLPKWIDAGTEEYSQDGTTILLPLRQKMVEFPVIQSSLLLFLHRLEKIVIQTSDVQQVLVKRHLSDSLVEVECNQVKNQWRMVRQTFSTPTTLKTRRSESTDMTLAFPVDLVDQQPVFAYLPLRPYGFRFVIQGNFVVPSSREAIDCENDWNQWLIAQIPTLFLQAFQEFKHEIYDYIPIEGEVMYPFSIAAREISCQLRQIECVKVQDDRYVCPHQVMMFEHKYEFISNEMLMESIGKEWLDPSLAWSDGLRRELGIQSIELSHLMQMIPHLSKWGPSKIASWFCLMLEYDNAISLSELPIFPLETGALVNLKNGESVFLPNKANSTLDELQILSKAFTDGCKVDDLLKAGIKPLEISDVIEFHIIPSYQSSQHDAHSGKYLDIVHDFYKQSKDLPQWWSSFCRDVRVPTADHGFVQVSQAAVYFPSKFSPAESPILHTTIEDPIFWKEIGVQELFTIQQIDQDWICPNLIAILPVKHHLNELVEELNGKWQDEFAGSTLEKDLRRIQWLKSSTGEFECSTKLWIPNEHVQSVFKSNVSYLDTTLSHKLTNTGFRQALGCRDEIDLDVLLHVMTLSKAERSDISQYVTFYRELMKIAKVDDFSSMQDAFEQHGLIFIRSTTTMVAPSSVFWTDPFQCTTNQLAEIYPPDLEYFFLTMLQIRRHPSTEDYCHHKSCHVSLDLLKHWSSQIKQQSCTTKEQQLIASKVLDSDIKAFYLTNGENIAIQRTSNYVLCDIPLFQSVDPESLIDLERATQDGLNALLLTFDLPLLSNEWTVKGLHWSEKVASFLPSVSFETGKKIVLQAFSLWSHVIPFPVAPTDQQEWKCPPEVFIPDVSSADLNISLIDSDLLTEIPSSTLESCGIQRLSSCLTCEILCQYNGRWDTVAAERLVELLVDLAMPYVASRYPDQPQGDWSSLRCHRVSTPVEIMYSIRTTRSKATRMVYFDQKDMVLYLHDSISIESDQVFREICTQVMGSKIGSNVANFLFVAVHQQHPQNWMKESFGIEHRESGKKRKFERISQDEDLAAPQTFHLTTNFVTEDQSLPGFTSTVDRNKETGLWGEEYVYQSLLFEQKKEQDESTTVIWVNQDEESGKPYDIEIRRGNKTIEYIEVKSTSSNDKQLFEITLNELAQAQTHGSAFSIYRVYNAGREEAARIARFRNPIALIRQKVLNLAMMTENKIR